MEIKYPSLQGTGNGVSDEIIAQFDQLLARFGWEQLNLRTPAIHVCERAWYWHPPLFKDFDFWLVLSGRGELSVNGQAHVLRGGAGFLLQPGDRVVGRHEPEEPLTVFACHFGLAGGEERISPGTLHFWIKELEPLRSRAQEAIRWSHEAAPARHLARPIMVEIILKGLLAWLGHVPAVASDALADVAQAIRACPGEAWSTEAMARRCFLSVAHFNRRFRSAFGKSPRRFIIEQRIRRAIQLLRESRMPISEIAGSLGYADVFFFHRQFKLMTGETPLQVRRGESARGAQGKQSATPPRAEEKEPFSGRRLLP